jgi:alanyl-tRNA synthetase
MATSRAAESPDVLAFDAEVVDIHEDGAVLELSETYFYPAGGGQPADRGTLAGAQVVDVAEADGGVRHHLNESLNVAVGEVVHGQIDPVFRRYCRRAHTASHVLYGAGRRLFEEIGYGGFDIDEERVRVDLTVPGGIDTSALVELERLTNRAVWDSRPVSWETVPREEALSRDDVAFNRATEEGLAGDTVRLVTVAEWDVAACGGTHVENTREIGPVTVLDRSNPGEGLSRVEFAVGPTGIERRAAESESLRSAATTLGVPPTDVDEAVVDLEMRYDEVVEERDGLRADVLADRIASLPSRDRSGQEWRVGVIEGYGPNELGEQVRDSHSDILAVIGREGSTFVVIGSDGDPPAGEVVESVTAEFGGGGGGSPSFAQAGGIEADPDDVLEFLRAY